MDAEHFSLNRPVHLARRDVYYEQAVDLLYEPETERGADELVRRYEHILFLLNTARRHAKAAVRVNGTDETDQEFCGFVKLLIGNVRAITAMLRQQRYLQRASGFIGSSPKIEEQAEAFERRAKDVLEGVHNILSLARDTFTQLKKANLKSMQKADRARYIKARKQFAAGVEKDRGVSLYDDGLGIAVEDM
ncbi:MAG: hypothetical protein K9M45_09185 [Kiritimatiellales bacterium]|nr:hypothetical protein [Kiritimatiellales bacterium]